MNITSVAPTLTTQLTSHLYKVANDREQLTRIPGEPAEIAELDAHYSRWLHTHNIRMAGQPDSVNAVKASVADYLNTRQVTGHARTWLPVAALATLLDLA